MPTVSVNGGVAVDHVTGTDIFLFNSSDRLVLLDENGAEVDRVVWDNGATFPDPNGASMSLAGLGPRQHSRSQLVHGHNGLRDR